MQRIFLLAAVFFITVSAQNCNKKKDTEEVYKGRLEIKALCMNYTVKLTAGNIDTSKIVSNWTDESTNKNYSNVFGLQNPCNFPAGVKEGEEFYFILDTSAVKDCAVCMAYYPTPPKKLAIKIIEK